MNKKLHLFPYLILFLILFSSCADKTIVTQCMQGEPYGFWYGLWHGIVAPFDFIGMIIYDDVSMYAKNNNGAWYAFGFLLGSGGWGLLAILSSNKK